MRHYKFDRIRQPNTCKAQLNIIMSLESGVLKRNWALLGGREEMAASDLQLKENIQ